MWRGPSIPARARSVSVQANPTAARLDANGSGPPWGVVPSKTDPWDTWAYRRECGQQKTCVRVLHHCAPGRRLHTNARDMSARHEPRGGDTAGRAYIERVPVVRVLLHVRPGGGHR